MPAQSPAITELTEPASIIRQIEDFRRDRKLVGFGAGLGMLQTQETTPLDLAYLVDSTPGLAGRSVAGFPILDLEGLTGGPKETAVIIYANTPRAVTSMAAKLSSLGYIFGEDYLDSSLLHVESIGKRLHRLGIQTSRRRFDRCRALCLNTAVPSMTQIAGTWLMAELLEHCRRIPGGIAECGVYKGGNALLVLSTSDAACERSYHLLDSFAGFHRLSDADPQRRATDFRDASFAQVRDLFANFKNVTIHPGFFEKTLPALKESSYCSVYIDCDLYEPTKLLLEYFWKRISPGGLLMLHDCWQPPSGLPAQVVAPFTGIIRAVREFFPSGTELVSFPETTHVLIRKPDPHQ